MSPIRRARPEDAGAIDRVHVHAWRRAYGDFIPHDRMPDGMRDEDERAEVWRERLEHPEIETYVHEVDGFVAGFSSFGADELWALYVDPAAQGAGVGTELLEQAEERMRAAGSSSATLWVFTAGEHGRRFYEARGWELVEGSEEQGDWAAPGVCYRKRL